MWSRSKKLIGFGIGIGTSCFAIQKYGIVDIVEAGEKPPYPPQHYCIGKECPKTRWDDDWDKKEGVDALRSRIIIVAHGQADTDQASSKNKKVAKPQKVVNKGKNVQVQKLPSDPNRFVKPEEIANDANCIDNSNDGTPAAGGRSAGAGDDVIEGLSPLGVSQVKKFLAFFREEYRYPKMGILIHGTDPPTLATAKIMENGLEKSRSFANVETTMLDPLTAPLPGQEPDGNPHPGDLARLEAVFRKYFHRIAYDDDSYEWGSLDVIVCPPNLVGYFVCRFLQIPTDRFTSWGVANGSITELIILANGRCVVQRVGDIGFMPLNDITYE